jgi:hypothetical protein
MRHQFHDPALARLAALAESVGAEMKAVPQSTGIGAPGTAASPASLARSPMSTSGTAPAAIPFPRAATLATMKDKTQKITFGSTAKWTLQTNAFLECLILDISLVTSGNAAAVAFAADAPWSLIARVQLTDPAGESIISPITGYQLYLLNKYLIDVECSFDPKADPHYTAVTGTGATGGSVSMRLIVPIEHRRRNALGAVNNSAANQRYRLTIQSAATAASLYSTAPTTAPTLWTCQITQQYWTTPPASIRTKTGTVATSKTPAGLGTVAFVRYERHNDVTGGGVPTFQLTNVGDYISQLIFILRDSSGARDLYAPPTSTTAANWPPTFGWWVNDFQVHALSAYGPSGRTSARGIGGVWPREMARFYGYTKAYETAGGLDNGVYTLTQMVGLMTETGNGWTSNQYLPTDATTKLQVRGSTFGPHSKEFEVLVRIIRPISGKALFS